MAKPIFADLETALRQFRNDSRYRDDVAETLAAAREAEAIRAAGTKIRGTPEWRATNRAKREALSPEPKESLMTKMEKAEIVAEIQKATIAGGIVDDAQVCLDIGLSQWLTRVTVGDLLAALTEDKREYLIGDATMARVFRAAGLTNLSDLQAVMDAVEAALTADRPSLLDIAAERRRQIEVEGWTPEHDDKHEFGDIAQAAAAYAFSASERGEAVHVLVERDKNVQRAGWFNLPWLIWPWSREWFKPGDNRKPADRRRCLVKAGALIVAEIERVDRANARLKA